MKRLLAIAVVGLAALVAVLLTIGAGGGSGDYRVDAIFDSADFLISGQDVKVAGARVGQVTKVALTNDRKARIEMQIVPGFAPFRANASCSIRPASLIGEKFVQCDPGTPDAAPLTAPHGRAPTVPISHNHSPVDLDLVFTALRQPIRERLSIIISELGAGLAGHPAELSAAIRRANPALEQANRTLAILDSQRSTLGRLIDSSDTVLRELAARSGDVGGFIAHASHVSDTVASRTGDLALAIHRLPPLLAQLEPASEELGGFATDARPVVRALGAAAPQLRDVLGDLPPLEAAARPTLVKLSALSAAGLHAVRETQPLADLLDPVSRKLPPAVALVKGLVDSLIARGVPEGIGRFVWLSVAATGRFDQISHVLPSYQLGGTCNTYATTPTAGCSAHFSGVGKGAPNNGGSTAAGALAGGGTAGSASGARDNRTPAERRRDRRLAQQAAQSAAHSIPGTHAPPVPNPGNLLNWLLPP